MAPDPEFRESGVRSFFRLKPVVNRLATRLALLLISSLPGRDRGTPPHARYVFDRESALLVHPLSSGDWVLTEPDPSDLLEANAINLQRLAPLTPFGRLLGVVVREAFRDAIEGRLIVRLADRC